MLKAELVGGQAESDGNECKKIFFQKGGAGEGCTLEFIKSCAGGDIVMNKSLASQSIERK